jgi:hypothetical protein
MKRSIWLRTTALLGGTLIFFRFLSAQNFDALFLRRTFADGLYPFWSSGKSEISLYRLVEEPFWEDCEKPDRYVQLW